MIRKFITLLTFSLLALSATSCASKTTENQPSENQKQMKTIVTFFSATGTTKNVAEQIAEITNADIMEIVPAPRYSDADLDWHDNQSRSSLEMADNKCRPEIEKPALNPANYDIIYIGYPIWWDLAPRQINTFIESNDLKGKTIIPFATSGGSGIEHSAKALREEYPELNWQPGLLLNTSKVTASQLNLK